MGFLKKWSTEIDAAGDDDARRRLLGQIGVWRASHLSDVPSLREAAGAMARLYALLGEHEQAIREARGLVSLCQTPPVSPKADLQSAQALLGSLGGDKAVVGPRPAGRTSDRERRRDQRERPPRGKGSQGREQGPDRLAGALDLARNGRFKDAEEALSGGRGPRTALARTWVRLAWALSAPDESSQIASVRDIEAWLRGQLRIDDSKPSKPSKASKTADAAAAPREPNKPRTPKPPPADAHPLEELVGQEIPRRWRDRLEILEAAAVEQADRIDQIAALALDHHVAVSGEKAPAPWLASIVGQALATTDATQTKATIQSLTERGAYAVSLYGEPVFERLVAVQRAATDRGWTTTSLRRGVLSRGEPVERRVWTLRLVDGDTERLLAMAPAADEPMDGDLAERVATRLPELCTLVALVAQGPGNAPLCESATKRGIAVIDSTEPGALLDALSSLSPVTVPPPPEDELSALLASGVPDDAALDAAIATFPRVYLAFRSAEGVLDARTDSSAQTARAAFLRAAHRVAPPSARIPEGTTWSIHLAASGTAPDLLDGSTRYGGPAVDMVVALTRALTEAGMSPDRILHGPTRRERRSDEVLGALDSELGGLWRLRSEAGEVAVLSDLTPEGKAAATRLLLDDKRRVVVVPVDGDLLDWWRQAGGADPIGWTGGEAGDVVAALKAP